MLPKQPQVFRQGTELSLISCSIRQLGRLGGLGYQPRECSAHGVNRRVARAGSLKKTQRVLVAFEN